MAVLGGGDNETEIEITVNADKAISDTEKLSQQIEKLSKTVEEGGTQFSDFQKKIITANEAMQLGTQVGSAIIGGIKLLGSAVLKLADAGATLGDLKSSFESLGGSSASIQEASDKINGILPKVDLLSIANKALVAGLPQVNENFGLLAEYGKKAGDALGLSAKEGIDKVTQAMVTGRPVALKQLGLTGDIEKASLAYAEANGIVGRSLTDSEKKLALQTQSWAEMRDQLSQFPQGAADVQDGIEGIEASLANMLGEQGLVINGNEDLSDSLQGFNKTLNEIDLTEFTENIGDLASWLVDLASSTVKASVAFVNDFARGLKIVGTLIHQIGNGELPSLAKAQMMVAEEIASTNVELKEEAQVREEGKGPRKRTIEDLKTEGDLQEVLKNKLEAQKKARDDAAKAQEEAAKKAEEAMLTLRKEIKDFNTSADIGDLEAQIEKAFNVGDQGSLTNLKEKLSSTIYEGLEDGFVRNGGVLNEESIQNLLNRTEQEVEATFQRIEQSAKKYNPWDDLLGGAFGESSADRTIAQMQALGSTLENTIADAIITGFTNGFNSENIKGLTANLGSSIGSIYGGPIGGAIGGLLGNKIGGAVTEFGDNRDSTINSVGTAIDTVFPGLGTALATITKGLLGGGNSRNEQALINIDKWIQGTRETNNATTGGLGFSLDDIDTQGFFDQLDGDWASTFWNDFKDNGAGAFSALGEGLVGIIGVTEDVGGQLGYLLASSVNGNLDEARFLLRELGIGAEDLEQIFMKMGESGSKTWAETIGFMNEIENLTGAGLVGIGDLDGAMTRFIESGGRGTLALEGIRDLAIEGIEAGASSLEELKQTLLASGQYSVTQINALFTALSQRGITSLDQLRDSSNLTLGQITADADNLGFAFTDSVAEGVDSSIRKVEDLRDALNKMPEQIEKKVVLKVETKYSDDNAKKLMDEFAGPGVGR